MFAVCRPTTCQLNLQRHRQPSSFAVILVACNIQDHYWSHLLLALRYTITVVVAEVQPLASTLFAVESLRQQNRLLLLVL
jgi:hypothetical protein